MTQQKQFRPLDQWLGPKLDWLQERYPWISPNKITTLRLLFLPVYCLSFYKPELLPLAIYLCFVDGLTDILDGVWAHRYDQMTRGGQYYDQFSDKVSVWVRIYMLWSFFNQMPAPPSWSFKSDQGVTWFWGILVVAFVFDMVNLVRRTWNYIKDIPSPPSVKWGKAKVWFQAYGISLFTIYYATKVCEFPIAVVIATFATCVSIIYITPPKKVDGIIWVRDREWYLLATGNVILTGLGLFPALSHYALGVGQFGFMGSVGLAFVSAVLQTKASMKSRVVPS